MHIFLMSQHHSDHLSQSLYLASALMFWFHDHFISKGNVLDTTTAQLFPEIFHSNSPFHICSILNVKYPTLQNLKCYTLIVSKTENYENTQYVRIVHRCCYDRHRCRRMFSVHILDLRHSKVVIFYRKIKRIQNIFRVLCQSHLFIFLFPFFFFLCFFLFHYYFSFSFVTTIRSRL